MERKALFYIEGKEVQHIGCRLTVTRELIRAGFTKGGAFNLPDGRVEVVLEGDEDRIKYMHKEVRENLVNWLEQGAVDRKTLKRRMGNPHPSLTVTDLEFKEDLLVLDIGLFSHSLTFDQIYKGVDVYKELIGVIKNLNDTLKGKSG
ncbi:MAG: acylphosphatase [Methanocellales archaeon]|nr:acylphosphatase [Methanocellales archaeon]